MHVHQLVLLMCVIACGLFLGGARLAVMHAWAGHHASGTWLRRVCLANTTACMKGEHLAEQDDAEALLRALSKPLPGISMEVGLAYCDHRHVLYLRVLRQFFDGKAEEGERVRKALLLGDFEVARKIAHALKSTSGSIGAVQLSQASGNLEHALREGALERLPLLEEAFLTEFRLVFSERPPFLQKP